MDSEIPKDPEIVFAPTVKLDQFPLDLVDEFVELAIGVDPEGVLMTDESCVSDFDSDERSTEEMVKAIYVEFDVDVSDMKPLRIPEILSRIEKHRASLDRGDPEC